MVDDGYRITLTIFIVIGLFVAYAIYAGLANVIHDKLDKRFMRKRGLYTLDELRKRKKPPQD